MSFATGNSIDKISESKRNPSALILTNKARRLATTSNSHGVLEASFLVLPFHKREGLNLRVGSSAHGAYRASKLAKSAKHSRRLSSEFTDAESLELSN